MANPTVWLYWDAPSTGTPGYIRLCEKNIREMARPYRVVILNKDNAAEYIPDLLPNFGDIEIIAHRADYIRAAVLSEHGGFWLDIDSILFRPLSLLWSLVPASGALFYGWRPHQPSIGMIAAEPRHEMLIAWRSRAEAILRKDLNQKWAGVGYDLLWPIAEMANYSQISNIFCSPLHWSKTGVFQEDMSVEEAVPKQSLMVQLFNKGLAGKVGTLSEEEILNSPTLLARMFEKASNVANIVCEAGQQVCESELLVSYLTRSSRNEIGMIDEDARLRRIVNEFDDLVAMRDCPIE